MGRYNFLLAPPLTFSAKTNESTLIIQNSWRCTRFFFYLNLLKVSAFSSQLAHDTFICITCINWIRIHFKHTVALTICMAVQGWGALTWRSSAAPSWGWARGAEVQSGRAQSEWFPETRCQPCSHTEHPSLFHTLPPLEPSWERDKTKVWHFKW